MPKISFLGIIVSEKKIFKELLKRTRTRNAYELPWHKVRMKFHSDLKNDYASTILISNYHIFMTAEKC
jgi:hypothetical protein